MIYTNFMFFIWVACCYRVVEGFKSGMINNKIILKKFEKIKSVFDFVDKVWGQKFIQTIDTQSVPGSRTAISGNFVGAVKEFEVKSPGVVRTKEQGYKSYGPPHTPVWEASGFCVFQYLGYTYEYQFSTESRSRKEAQSLLYHCFWMCCICALRSGGSIFVNGERTYPAPVTKSELPKPNGIPEISEKTLQTILSVFRQRLLFFETEGVEGIDSVLDEYIFTENGAETLIEDLHSGLLKAKLLSINPYKKDLTLEGIEPNPGPLTKKQFMSGRKARFDKARLTTQQRENAWKQYIASYKQPDKRIRVRPRKNRNRGQKPRASMEPGSMGASPVLNDNQAGSGPVKSVRRKGMGVQISDCGKMYALAVVNPFAFVDGTNAQDNCYIGLPCNLPATLPCVPSTPTFKSKRLMTQYRGSATVGSTGFLVIAFAPYRAASDYGTGTGVQADSRPPLITANANGYFPPMDDGADLASGVTALELASEMSSESLGGLVETRLVGAGMRIRYAGTEMNRGGIIHAIVEPNHASLKNQSTGLLSFFDTYFKCQVVRDWCTLSYSPATADELEFDTDAANVDFSAEDQAPKYNHYMGFVVQGSVEGSLFEIEAVAMLEVSGQNITNTSQGSSDIIALQAVTNVVTPATQQKVNSEGTKNTFTEVLNSVASATMGVAEKIIPEMSTKLMGAALGMI